MTSTKFTISREDVQNELFHVQRILGELKKRIVGQEKLLNRLLIGLLTGGHILVEGVPGLAKSMAVSSLAEVLNLDFKRIQFTPDLLPADLIGTMIFNSQTTAFEPRKGPIFTNVLLADEINRAPAKVQSALLEAMQEKQVTIGKETFPLTDPFLVLATQNPIEQEGTYPLPEAQVDRFLMKILISYPDKNAEKKILQRMTEGEGVAMDLARGRQIQLQKVIVPERIQKLRIMANKVYIDDRVVDYILDIVFATRCPADYGLDVARFIRFGSSPRGTIALKVGARAHAFLMGRNFVVPEDIKEVCADVLRHRILLSFEAEAQGITADEIIKTILNTVNVP
ncbi:MAG TPA: AAA family ATPase [Acidobacteriota bacterium]|jgi:MoxR-like ATPase|nr:AAA domain-containing protein [Acidobacteriota bacterium]HNT99932.1 AAA family ATPase [Acidobacteriota bacterium]HOB53004.1 AAA family ATPase [Acidobacteriota bacterium]HQF87221.1 AAA family ATPase [Acidobacteriota bacterium]HQG91782.1 AAA family ATPase [Acidobacteriota bacterium]